jgi:hypothetical protein
MADSVHGRALEYPDGRGGDQAAQPARTSRLRVAASNQGGGPTDDKPTVTLARPADPDRTSASLNLRAAGIAAAYAEWSAKGAEFLTGTQAANSTPTRSAPASATPAVS